MSMSRTRRSAFVVGARRRRTCSSAATRASIRRIKRGRDRTAVEETVRTLDLLVTIGKVRDLAVSNWITGDPTVSAYRRHVARTRETAPRRARGG
jgi:aryl-alcohol dehydrogenase-like predicted oxidoreductase